jgi:hypothetical protein
LILFSNALLLFTRKKILFNLNLLFILSFLLVHGAVMFFWNGNPIKSLFAQFIGITICSVYYHNYIRLFGPDKVFNAYLKMAYWVAALALPMWLFGINAPVNSRLNGIMLEPAHYAAIMLPALFVYYKKQEYKEFGVILLTILLAQSSMGYLGLLLVFVLPVFRFKYLFSYGKYIVLIGVGIILFLGSHWNDNFKENKGNQVTRRVKQTVESFGAIATGEFNDKVNLSSYAILSNGFVTGQSLLSKPLGVGLGGYSYQYDVYFEQMKLPLNMVYSKQKKINREDANSLLFRGLVDLGIFSLLLVGLVLYRGVKAYQSPGEIIPQGIFIYLLVKLIREGHYFPPEFYFFLLLFFNRSFYEKNESQLKIPSESK